MSAAVAAVAAPPQPDRNPTGAPTAAQVATLYVGNLPPNATEATLYEHFKEFGTVISIFVCRHNITRHSLGYAYVNFQSHDDAAKAKKERNLEPLDANDPDRLLTIMWSERDPAKRRNPVGNVFIKGLAPTITQKELYEALRDSIGALSSVKLALDEEGKSKCYGYAQFENPDHAKKCIEELNGAEIEGSTVTISEFIPRAQRQTQFTNVYVKNIPANWDQERFVEECNKFGKVNSLHFLTKKEEGDDSKDVTLGWAMANFETQEQAKAAVEGLPKVEVGEGLPKMWAGPSKKKEARARELKNRAAHSAKTNVYVKNLPLSMDDEKLKEMFAKYGTITSAKVARDAKGGAKGFGFVNFASAEEATKAITSMNDTRLEGHPNALFVGVFQPKAEREQVLARQKPQQQLMGQMLNMPMSTNMGNRGMPNQAYPGMFSPQAMMLMWQQMQMQMLANQQAQQQQQVNRRVAQGTGGNYAVQGRRNQRQPQQPQQQQAQQQQVQQQQKAAAQPQQFAAALAQASEAEKKRMLGEKLYPLINSTYPQAAGKITGMLLEMETSELLELLDNKPALQARMNEAYSVLQKAQTGSGN
eukprot:m.352084 g.352084  ORF g.352084 m.352084 type:complete len:588 (+) comp16433_c0_seq1:279-2042(+)